MDDLDVLTRRLDDELLDGAHPPVDPAACGLQQDRRARALGHAAALGQDGAWGDIDYDDPAADHPWPAVEHVQRLLLLGQACRAPGAGPATVTACGRAACRALAEWLRRDPVHWNWWYNQIGVPQPLGGAVLLLRKQVPAELLADAARILRRADWHGATGANLVWLAHVQVVRGCLERDEEVVREALAAIAAEARPAEPRCEGIHVDASFYQHGEVLMSGSYGLSFAADTARWAALAAGTRFAFAPDQVDVLSRLILDGQQWLIRGTTIDPGTTGREITRPGHRLSGLAQACRRLAAAGVPRAAELEAMARRLEAPPAAQPLVGNRHFWKGDLMAHHRRGFYASARLLSNRLDNTDSCCTNENKRSHLIADGANFVMVTGEEYRDIYPVWDWHRIPGVTAELSEDGWCWQAVRSRGVKDFVGGVSDGLYGCAYMDYARWNVVAHKAWFCFDRQVVCLGSQIRGAVFFPSSAPLITSVNQCHLHGPVTIPTAGGVETLPRGDRVLADPLWVHHDGVGYVFPEGGAVHVRNQCQTGSWTDIGQAPPGPVERPVFSLWLEHAAGPRTGSYCYHVVPGVGAAELPEYCRTHGVEVLPNRAAVWHRSLRLLAAAFAVPETVTTADGLQIGVDRPCLLLLREEGDGWVLAASNPRNLPLTVQVTVNRRLSGPDCVWDGARECSRLYLELPAGELAGQSLVRVLAPA